MRQFERNTTKDTTTNVLWQPEKLAPKVPGRMKAKKSLTPNKTLRLHTKKLNTPTSSASQRHRRAQDEKTKKSKSTSPQYKSSENRPSYASIQHEGSPGAQGYPSLLSPVKCPVSSSPSSSLSSSPLLSSMEVRLRLDAPRLRSRRVPGACPLKTDK